MIDCTIQTRVIEIIEISMKRSSIDQILPCKFDWLFEDDDSTNDLHLDLGMVWLGLAWFGLFWLENTKFNSIIWH